MKLPFVTLLTAVLVSSASGCCTMFNSHALLNPPVEEPRAPGKDVEIKILSIVASARGPTQVDVAAVYADGIETRYRLEADGSSWAWSKKRWVKLGAFRMPISRDPILEGDGLSLVGGTLRWVRAGRVVAHVRVAHTEHVPGPRRETTTLAKVWHVVKHVLFVPVAIAIDAVTWPIQLVTFPSTFFI